MEDENLVSIQRREGSSIAFDHFREEEKKIFLFDSKYTKNDKMPGLNYKQAFYHYYLMSIFPDKTIVNGLILPTSSTYSHYLHVDRATRVIFNPDNFDFYTTDSSFVDGLKIMEHKINLKETIELGARNIDRFRSNMLKFK